MISDKTFVTKTILKRQLVCFKADPNTFLEDRPLMSLSGDICVMS